MMLKIWKTVAAVSLTIVMASCNAQAPETGAAAENENPTTTETPSDLEIEPETEIPNEEIPDEETPNEEDVSEVAKEPVTPKEFEFDNDTMQFAEIPEGEEVAIITTNMGVIKVRFFAEQAPKAVENFITHSKNGYYDGLTFHRVINDFMIQGGDPNGTGTGGESIWGEAFEDEFDIDLRHVRGSLAMANSGENTNGSQFFIVQNPDIGESAKEEVASIIEGADEIISVTEEGEEIALRDFYPPNIMQKYADYGGTPHLDFSHTVFGMVYEGMDIVDEIAKVEADPNSKPLEAVIIENIQIVNYEK